MGAGVKGGRTSATLASGQEFERPLDRERAYDDLVPDIG